MFEILVLGVSAPRARLSAWFLFLMWRLETLWRLHVWPSHISPVQNCHGNQHCYFTMASSIKGGGRAALSEENVNRIVDLLRLLRDPVNPLQPRTRQHDDDTHDGPSSLVTSNGNDDNKNNKEQQKTRKPLSDHDLKRERKRFLKRLIEQYERAELQKKINGIGVSSAAAPSTKVDPSSRTTATSTGDINTQTQELRISDQVDVVSGNVRITLVEAVYPKHKDSVKKSKKKSKEQKKEHKKDKKKAESSSKKSKESHFWNEGTSRKTVVFDRSATAKELMKEAKNKLNMKKPTRLFFVDSRNKMEMDLTTNLAGLEDGSTVYATSHVVEVNQKSDDSKQVGGEATIKEETVELIDPLDAVKEAYAKRRRLKSRNRNRHRNHTESEGRSSKRRVGEHPVFANHFNNLEPLSASRAALPAAAFRTKVLESLDKSRVVVICGATGCGKSTQVSQFILEGMAAAGRADDANILVTQPRRVAAISLAERVASERNSPPPGSCASVIGYNVRLARRISDDAKIVYCTVGILLRMLVNPTEDDDVESCPSSDCNQEERKESTRLSSISHIIIDEVHERDLNTDFALTLLRPLLAENKHIRVILMSATANASLFVDYFRSSRLGIDPLVLSIPGRTFPVTHKCLADCEKFAGMRLNGWKDHVEKECTKSNQDGEDEVQLSPRATARIDNDFICNLIVAIIGRQREDGHLAVEPAGSEGFRETGAILVFLPGKGEIESLARTLRDDHLVGDATLCNILKLHSTVPLPEQRKVFMKAKVGTAKIILSTNVAETSVTVPDVSEIIDSGRVKESRFNSSSRIKELVTVWTSQASATQRAGRAGRTGPGTYWKLYTEQFCTEHMPQRTSPEIVRTPLDELVLQCCLLNEQRHDIDNSNGKGKGCNVVKFLEQAPEPPPLHGIMHACEHLLEVGGLDLIATEPDHILRLTPLGFHLSHMPLDAKVAKCLVVGCILECIEPALTIAASLSHTKSIWLPYLPGYQASKKETREVQERLVQEGFGGKNWKGGTVKGDLIGVIAAFDGWSACDKENDRRKFASKYGLDHNVLRDLNNLRSQFCDALIDAGFLEGRSKSSWDSSHDDALFTSCCLVAGLYPNISTLMRPRKGRGNLRGGRLITKDGDMCKASSSSFQANRLWNANDGGPDAYAVYHEKHRTVGTVGADAKPGGQMDVYLNEINFISRFALLLFAGNIETRDNAIILDGWLKFKVGEKTRTGAILIVELRKEVDMVMTRHVMSGNVLDEETAEECHQVLSVIRRLLEDQSCSSL